MFEPLLVGAVVTVILVVLFGLFGRESRRAAEAGIGRGSPACGRCGYGMRGWGSPVCPECGASALEVEALYGSRRARGLLGQIATCLALLGAIACYVIGSSAAPHLLPREVSLRTIYQSVQDPLLQFELECTRSTLAVPLLGISGFSATVTIVGTAQRHGNDASIGSASWSDPAVGSDFDEIRALIARGTTGPLDQKPLDQTALDAHAIAIVTMIAQLGSAPMPRLDATLASVEIAPWDIQAGQAWAAKPAASVSVTCFVVPLVVFLLIGALVTHRRFDAGRRFAQERDWS